MNKGERRKGEERGRGRRSFVYPPPRRCCLRHSFVVARGVIAVVVVVFVLVLVAVDLHCPLSDQLVGVADVVEREPACVCQGEE